MPYAFDEFRTLMPSPISVRDPIVRYLCALASELAYHHVSAFEIDSNRRAKIIPCRRHIEIVNAGNPTNVLQYLRPTSCSTSDKWISINHLLWSTEASWRLVFL